MLSFLILILCLSLSIQHPNKVQAQEEPFATPGPQSYSASVSATMPDIVPPSAPLLISPEDDELVNTNRPQFVWREATDNVAMSHYQLYLDGTLELDNLDEVGTYPLYSLAYNSTLGYYYLDVIYNLDQGQHTWKITAVDAVGLTNDSVTWSFTVDSVAPQFVLTDIGDETVTISAQDASTVPDQPIQLDNNEPLLLAYGEPYSEVQLTVEIPGQDNHYVEVDINGEGNWSYRLPILPRDKIITLNFTIIDLANHISTLTNVKIIIPSQLITIPQVTVTPVPGSFTSLITDVSKIIKPEPTPSQGKLELIKTPIIIPIKPAKELVHDVIRWLTPTPILEVTARPWFVRWLAWLGPWLVLLIVSWPAIIATLLLARQFGFLISGKHLLKIWQVLGVIPYQDREGWIFNSNFPHWLDNKIAREAQRFAHPGIAFAQLFALSKPEQPGFPPFYQTVLTDRNGLYLPLQLPINKYQLSVQAEHFRYPTLTVRPPGVPLTDYYQAEEQEVAIDRISLSLQIPVDPVSANPEDQPVHSLKAPASLLEKLKNWLAKIIVFDNFVVLANIVLASFVILFWPSLLNLVCLAVYLILGLYYLFKDQLFGNVKGIVVDKNSNFVQNALVRLIKQDGSRQTFVALTNQEGRFCFHFKTGDYKLRVNRPGFEQAISSVEDQTVVINNWWEQKRLALLVS